MASEEFSNLHFFIHVIYDGLRWRKWGIKQFFSFFFFFTIVSWNDNFRKKSAFSCIENFQVIKLHKVRLLDTTHPAPSLKCDPIFFIRNVETFLGGEKICTLLSLKSRWLSVIFGPKKCIAVFLLMSKTSR